MLDHKAFYDSLSKHKIELYQGKVYIGGNLSMTQHLLSYILRGYGTDYILPIVPKELLQEACIEAYGRGDFLEPVHLPAISPHFPATRMASELMMNIFGQRQWGVFGRDSVVKIGEDAFTPDVYVFRDQNDPRQKSYYFDGAPDLIVEIIHPAMKDFDEEVRLIRYMDAQVPEIWMIEYETERFTLYRLQDQAYEVSSWDGSPLASTAISGLIFHPEHIWTLKQNPWQNVRDLVTVDDSVESNSPKPPKNMSTDDSGWGSLPFQPVIALDPSPISFKQFISWAPEAKFEWWDGRPNIGGGTETTLYLTGLLLMSLGLVEAVKLVPQEMWKGIV